MSVLPAEQGGVSISKVAETQLFILLSTDLVFIEKWWEVVSFKVCAGPGKLIRTDEKLDVVKYKADSSGRGVGWRFKMQPEVLWNGLDQRILYTCAIMAKQRPDRTLRQMRICLKNINICVHKSNSILAVWTRGKNQTPFVIWANSVCMPHF